MRTKAKLLLGAASSLALVIAGATAASCAERAPRHIEAQVGNFGLQGSTTVAYVGPGDVVPGATVYYAMRAYNAAYATAHGNLVMLCGPSDATCETETAATNGSLALGTFGATCNLTTIICTVKEWYDQIGSNNAIQATIANRSTFNPSLGPHSTPGAVFASASSQSYTSSATITQAQPLTLVAFGERTSVAQMSIFSNATASLNFTFGWNSTANTARAGYGSGSITQTATDSATHSFIGVPNGASSSISIDGSTVTGNAGTNGFSAVTACIGGESTSCASHFLNGDFFEGGMWPFAFNSTQIANANSNQTGWW